MFCKFCGNQIQESKFCPYCGRPQGETAGQSDPQINGGQSGQSKPEVPEYLKSFGYIEPPKIFGYNQAPGYSQAQPPAPAPAPAMPNAPAAPRRLKSPKEVCREWKQQSSAYKISIALSVFATILPFFGFLLIVLCLLRVPGFYSHWTVYILYGRDSFGILLTFEIALVLFVEMGWLSLFGLILDWRAMDFSTWMQKNKIDYRVILNAKKVSIWNYSARNMRYAGPVAENKVYAKVILARMIVCGVLFALSSILAILFWVGKLGPLPYVLITFFLVFCLLPFNIYLGIKNKEALKKGSASN